MEEALRSGKRHEDSAVFKTICGSEDADDVKVAVAYGDAAADGGVEEVGRAGAEDNVVIAFAEIDAIAGEPGSFADARIAGRDAKAGDDGVVGAGDDSEEDRVSVRDSGPGRDFASEGRGDIAEEEIGDVAFEDDDFAVARQDAREHADGALKNRDDGEHGGHTKGDAGDADEGADAVPAEIGEDELEKDHDRSLVNASSAISQATSVTRRSSASRSLRSLERNDRAGRRTSRRWRARSPTCSRRSRRSTAPQTPMALAMLGRSRSSSRAAVFAGFRGVLQNIFEIVDRLVGEAPADSDALKELDLAGGCAAKHRGNDKGKANERDGLAASYTLGGFASVGERGVVQIEALAVEQARDAEALFDVGHDLRLRRFADRRQWRAR